MRKQTWMYGLGFLILVCSLSIAYEGWIDRGEVALKQALVDLTNDMTIMCLAAHPDDEDGATLTYYRKKHGVRTVILVATRGEGGQNQIGPELYEELGVIRAYETQAAANIYGADVYNLNKRDFGYSKRAEETFRFWGHEDSLRRLVRVIREEGYQLLHAHTPRTLLVAALASLVTGVPLVYELNGGLQPTRHFYLGDVP